MDIRKRPGTDGARFVSVWPEITASPLMLKQIMVQLAAKPSRLIPRSNRDTNMTAFTGFPRGWLFP